MVDSSERMLMAHAARGCSLRLSCSIMMTHASDEKSVILAIP